MKFVFALALVALCVMYMHARPNVEKRAVDEGRLHKRSGRGHKAEDDPLAADLNKAKKKQRGHHADDEGVQGDDEPEKAYDDAEGEPERHHVKTEKYFQKSPRNKGEEKESPDTNGGPERKKRVATSDKIHLWPKATDGFKEVNIPYKFVPEDFATKTRCKKENCKTLEELMEAAAAEWNFKSGLNIHRDQQATGRVIEIHDGSGCWSWVGYQPEQKNELNLEYPSCLTHGVILHELGHALGLIHEVKRKDRDKNVEPEFTHIETDMASQFTKDPNSVEIVSDYLHTKNYDFCSIMHYSPKAFSKDGKDTLKLKNMPKDEEDEILPCLGSQLGLSLVDGMGVAELYGKLAHFDETEKFGCQYGGYRLTEIDENDAQCRCSNLFEGKKCETPINKGDGDCGENVFNLGTGEVGTFKTPNFPNEYPLSQKCTWTVTCKEPNSKVCVAFPAGYNVEAPSLPKDENSPGVCAFDWFELVLSETLTLKTKRYCGHDVGWYHSYDSSFSSIVFESDDAFPEGGFQGALACIAEKSDDLCKKTIENADVITWDAATSYEEYYDYYEDYYHGGEYYYYYYYYYYD